MAIGNDGNQTIPENNNKTAINNFKIVNEYENEMVLSSIFSSYLHQRFTISTTNSSSGDDNAHPNFFTATELDSHADSPVVGNNCAILEDMGRTARVSGFTKVNLANPLQFQ